MNTYKDVLVIPDIHYRRNAGGEDRKTLAAVKRYASDHRWDEVIFLGDVMDHNSISSHNKNNLRAVRGETLLRDYSHANLDLDEWEQATRGAKHVMIEGNHDYRPEALIDAQPQLAGLVETRIGLKLTERGWRWVPFWSKGKTYRIGKATFLHGLYTNDHHAKKHVEAYGQSVFYGHLHDIQGYSKVLQGDDSTLVGQSMGCLCSYRQHYMRGRPHRWQQAFGVFRFRPNGNYNYFVVQIFNHRFTSPDGILYKP